MIPSSLKRFKFNRKAPRRRPIRRTHLRLEELESRLAPSTNVLTYHSDIASTGLNPNETLLTPSNVKVGSFDKLFTTATDGQVYAEPLVDTAITISSGVNTKAGAAGVHDVVFVATEHDSLYAIDAGSGAVLWQRTFLDTTNPTGDINNTLSSTAISTVLSADVSSSDISPEIGITGTPVIDASTNLIYLVVKTKETIGGNVHFVQRLHAINIGDGTDAVTPFLIGDTTNGNSNNTMIYVYGSGDGHVTDPYNSTGKQVVQFNALREHQRGALNLVNNQIYVEWASHGDNGPYHGWVVVWDITNVKTSGFLMKGVFNTSPNNGLSGIWQGGGRLAFEADGSAFYFETGNGNAGAPVLNASGFPTSASYNEALVKLVADSTTTTTSQNPNGWGLKVADYFIPYNVTALDGADSDFGSGAPCLLPDSAGITGHPHLMVAAGKEGKIYLVDRDNMGHFDPNNDHVLNAVPNGSGQNTPPVQIAGSLSTAAFFNGKIYWVSGYSSTANAYVINANGTLSITSQTANANFGGLPGSVIVSANGLTAGIVWVMDRDHNQIHAYDAATFATELWNSGQKVGGADNLGATVKFAVPTEANGEVFVGTSNSLVIYGQTQGPIAVPNAPVLSATALSGNAINLTWTDSTPGQNAANGYLIEQSTDNVTFTQVTTAPAGATSIALGSLSPLTTYYFRIRGFNSIGDSAYSNTASATTTNQIAFSVHVHWQMDGTEVPAGYLGDTGLVFGSRGNGLTFGWNLDNTANMRDRDSILSPDELHDGLGHMQKPTNPNAWWGLAVSDGTYSVHLLAGDPTATDSVYKITVGATLSGSTFSGGVLAVNGVPTTSNHWVENTVTVNVTGGVLYVSNASGSVNNKIDTIDITQIVTGTSPNAPSGLGAVPASATSVSLNWTNNAANQSGFHLDRATDVGFTVNLITQTLPASPNTFTDTATGLAPGNTFYYRLRAFNSVGDSGNSNVASVTIPQLPPKPTNQQVTNVTTTEIDMSWQDNAGHLADGYKILRAANHGTFSQVASLPPTSRTPPSTYLWSDLNLTPGTFYEYHIIAYNVSGNIDYAGVNATTLTLPPSVSAAAGNTVVTLSWTAPTGAQTYNVYRGTTAGGEGITPLATGITATGYTDSGLTNGTTYYYTVTAVNANTTIVPAIPSESARSSEVSATPNIVTPPPPPTNLAATGTPANQASARITLTWTASTGAITYNVYRSLTSNGEASPALATGITGTSYTDTGVAFGTTYFYKVTAVNAGGESTMSFEASATLLLSAHIHWTGDATEPPVAGYLADTGLVSGSRVNGLTFGWNLDNTANMRDRDSLLSPDELHDGLGHMQKPTNPNAWWGLAVPNGTYSVHLLAGDPTATDSVYKITVGATLSGSTFSGGVLAVNGVPTTSNHWVENTVTVSVTGGVLYVSNASGSVNNKIDAIDITQVAGMHAVALNTIAGVQPMGLRGSVLLDGSKPGLIDVPNSHASAFTTSNADVAALFGLQLTNPTADGFAGTFRWHDRAGGDSLLGHQGMNIELDFHSNEEVNSGGSVQSGVLPPSRIGLPSSVIDLHGGQAVNLDMIFDGTSLVVTFIGASTHPSWES